MNNTVAVHDALKQRVDDRGYVRCTIDEMALATGLSRSTVKRALTQLVVDGLIRRRVKDGRSGGVLIRLETGSQTGSQTGSKPVQTDPVDHVFTQGLGPEGALESLGCNPETGSKPVQRRDAAYRTVGPHETTASQAEFIYTGPHGDGIWHQIGATVWLAPNGDSVSIKNMTPELRLRLRADG